MLLVLSQRFEAPLSASAKVSMARTKPKRPSQFHCWATQEAHPRCVSCVDSGTSCLFLIEHLFLSAPTQLIK